MTGVRVLVADTVKAQLYELPGLKSSLKSLQCFVNPAGQAPERAQGNGTNRPAGRQGVKEHAEEVFVRQVGSALATDAAVKRGASLVLVAAPRLLGVYRQHLPAAVRDRIALEMKVDLTKLPVTELSKRVREAVKALPMAVTAEFRSSRRRSLPPP